MLYQIKVICLSIFFLSGNLLAQELEIKKEYLSYVDDFIVFDFDGLVSHFETPAMFIGSSTGVMADPESLKNYYRNLQSNIQTGYAYSTVDELTITEISEVVYLVTASFTR